MPRKMSGREMSMMEPSMVAINMPMVVLTSATHL